MTTVVHGVLHLLDWDGTALCACPFGLLTGSLDRCTCLSCFNLWYEAKDRSARRPLVSGDAEEVAH